MNEKETTPTNIPSDRQPAFSSNEDIRETLGDWMTPRDGEIMTQEELEEKQAADMAEELVKKRMVSGGDVSEKAKELFKTGWDIVFDVTDNHDGSIKVRARAGSGGNHDDWSLYYKLNGVMGSLGYSSVGGVDRNFFDGVEGVFIKKNSPVPVSQQGDLF